MIEDPPEGSFCVDPDRGTVDLYGYASTLVAAVRARGRRVEELERGLATIERR